MCVNQRGFIIQNYFGHLYLLPSVNKMDLNIIVWLFYALRVSAWDTVVRSSSSECSSFVAAPLKNNEFWVWSNYYNFFITYRLDIGFDCLEEHLLLFLFSCVKIFSIFFKVEFGLHLFFLINFLLSCCFSCLHAVVDMVSIWFLSLIAFFQSDFRRKYLL